MESLQVRTGQISLMILDDNGEERGVFKFNPQDIAAAKRVLNLQDEVKQKQVDFEIESQACNTDEERFNLLENVVTYYEGMIDECFGEGSSALLFGGAKTLSMFEDFFEGIMPYYEKASKDRMAKYQRQN